ncbi:MAG: hypothetical protein HYV07_20755 [Deltaproteobacteria bacterium]|nr:hypothetical protein [Deltaproteobacteria bacterium]
MRRALVILSCALLACEEAATDPCLECTSDAATTPDADMPEIGDTMSPDAGFADAAPPDTAPPDGGWLAPDVGAPLGRSTCAPCGPDCPGVCVNTGGPPFCVDACTGTPDACAAGMSCYDLGAESVCVPPVARCDWPLGFDALCFGDTSACHPDRDTCQGDVLGFGYCTSACTGDDCPLAHSCGVGDEGSRVCIFDLAPDAERCGREARADEAPCASDGDCAPGLVCVKGEETLPGICANACDASCAGECRFDTSGRAVCLPDRCACRGTALEEGDLVTDALAAAGLTRCSAVTSPPEWSQNPPDLLDDPYRMSFVNRILAEPFRGTEWAGSLVRELAGSPSTSPLGRAESAIVTLSRALDRDAIRVPESPIDLIDPLTRAIVEFDLAANGAPDEARIRAAASALPLALQLAVARVVAGAQRALEARARTFGVFDDASVQAIFDYGAGFIAPRADDLVLNILAPGVADALVSSIPHAELYGGAADLIAAIESSGIRELGLVPSTTTATTAGLLFDVATAAGRIAIGDSGNGIYAGADFPENERWVILIDLGGADEYRIGAGGTQSADNPVSVLIDLGGRDDYGYVETEAAVGPRLPADSGGRRAGEYPQSLSETPRQGGARVGIAVLADLGTDADTYRSPRLSQGSASFGVGVLVDEGGDDFYEVEVAGQGAASFGIGLLVDGGGSDFYRGYQEAQGFGFARGAGLVLDAGGDDRYELDVGDPALGGDPLYPAEQRPEASNASLGQGFGFGRRDDQQRGFMSGGLGILEDLAGDDHYRSSIFGGGGGYWFGAGILADREGADHYDGLWYVLGAAAHYALGFLLDGAGNDSYGREWTAINVTLGAGHDFSSAFLVDKSGNDEYRGTRISMGAGNASGSGIFVDAAGDDSYELATTYGLGAAGLLDPDLRGEGSPRRKTDFFGVFVDAGGSDAYVTPDGAPGDDRVWIQMQSQDDPAIAQVEKGVGIDGTAPAGLAGW